MAGITGRVIKERYAPGKRVNSFYKEQSLETDRTIGYVGKDSEQEPVYYLDERTRELRVRQTTLMEG